MRLIGHREKTLLNLAIYTFIRSEILYNVFRLIPKLSRHPCSNVLGMHLITVL